jgi:hypothetical protein
LTIHYEDCGIISQDKYDGYVKLVPEVCIPTIRIDLPKAIDVLTVSDMDAIRNFVAMHCDTYANEFVVKAPFVTNSKPKYGSGVDGILNAIRLFARDPPEGIQGYIPYIMIQPKIRSPCEIKIACFAGEARFRCGKRKGKKNSFKGIKEQVLFQFAENAIALLRERSPSFFWNQVIRVDIMLDTATNRLVVVEFEGFEADTPPMESEVDKDNKLYADIVLFWIETLLELINFHVRKRGLVSDLLSF